MSPIEALHQAIVNGFLSSMGYKTPGYIVGRMRGEEREALQNLTSADALKMRPDLVLVRKSSR